MISDYYKDQLQTYHTTKTKWAASGFRFIEQVSSIIENHNPATILDYGCGKGVLIKMIKDKYGKEVKGYDPGIKAYEAQPSPAEFVICTDVLEHIEPDYLDEVIKHLVDLTQNIIYLVIHTAHCGHYLPDGRQAHLIQKPMEWWKDKLDTAFGMELEYKPLKLPHRFEVKGIR